MSDDDYTDFFEAQNDMSQKWFGKDWTAESVTQRFPLFGMAKRIEALDGLDVAMRKMDSSGNLRKSAEMLALRRQLTDTHHALRKVGR
jgi:hypothetical protein